MLVSVWRSDSHSHGGVAWERNGGFSATYRFPTAQGKRRPVRNHDNSTANHQRNRRPNVKVLRPKRQPELGREVSIAVRGQRVGRHPEDGQAGEEPHGREGATDPVDEV